MKFFDIVIVGAGPAGLAAAHAAAYQAPAAGKAAGSAPGINQSLHICVIDDNPYAGGQIWRGGPQQQDDTRAQRLWRELQAAPNVIFMHQSRVQYAPAPGMLLVQGPEDAVTLRYNRLVLATGAREHLLPFPGWTLPGVSGAGGLQALAKGGYPVQGKRVVVAGSGPLLLAVAATLKAKGAIIAAIVEQASLPQLGRFALGLLATPAKLKQARQLRAQLRGVPYWSNSYVRAAHGTDRVDAVQIQRGEHIEHVPCDYLACGYGLLPNLELPMALGCSTGRAVKVDEWQQTSIGGIYCAGEGTGIGGVDLALAEGSIAGLAAAGQAHVASPEHVYALFTERLRGRQFAQRLARGFALRAELRQLAVDDTIVCRCEDVCHGELRQHASWRSAKLHTRCGMGPCQGRICGGATDTLYGWRPDAVRLPLSPTRIASIIGSE